ncbi:DinB family protein [Arthrobacter mangrovi]|uniref:DinB family protein n=1 Tax=Arthrobacter mangrovi TaxID=2966350 RepID=UPI002230B22D|nr:DinB family protein [Arthrobacter mangrovi]
MDTLLAFLAQQRYVLELTAYGLDEDQLRLRPTAGELSIGGLIKHVNATEASWIDVVEGRERRQDRLSYAAGFTLREDESTADLLKAYKATGNRTEQVCRALGALDAPVRMPDDPWFSARPEGYSLRWILAHLIAETARHAGHADIIRESIDGATAFPLMAAAEHWPPSDWMTPWTPPERSR